MIKYYTRACNFYFGSISIEEVRKKESIPLHGNRQISFDKVEIFTRKKIERIDIREINKLSKNIKKKVLADIKNIFKKKKI